MEDESLEMKQELDISTVAVDSEIKAVNGLQEESPGVRRVLIVGAGPAGLMLASNLVRFGIDIQIIDDRADKTSTGRADGLQPKTIETFRQLRLADELLKKGVKIYDICFWNSTPTSPMNRTSRQIHYPGSVDTLDPYVLLVHQGMIEDVFLRDLKSRGVKVTRSSPFVQCSSRNSIGVIDSTCQDKVTGQTKIIQSNYVIGCDGAHSQVRRSMSRVTMQGLSGNAAWGVIDGVIETDFPDIWSKAVVSSERAGSVLFIPRERNMTRLYIELHPRTTDPAVAEISNQNQDLVMRRAADILKPFYIRWKSIVVFRHQIKALKASEWFSVYHVGQRLASSFAFPSQGIFIVGDAAHTHSPKAAQGMNVSMHDSFNLAWKLNLVLRNIAPPSLLDTYEHERKLIAQRLIDFDFEHAKAFQAGDTQELAKNFDDNIDFISGMRAEYKPNELNEAAYPHMGMLKTGAILPRAMVTRYIDANPVDIQLDIPLLSQFRLYFVVPDIHLSMPFLNEVSNFLIHDGSVLWQASKLAEKSYELLPTKKTEADEYLLPERYNGFSKLFTPAILTTTKKKDVEIKDLPVMFGSSPWTVYLDDIGDIVESWVGSCTGKWFGRLGNDLIAIINVRPDGYVGSFRQFKASDSGRAKTWLDEYYGGFLNV